MGRMNEQKQPFASKASRLAASEKVRFGVVGIINTIVDFTVLLILGAGLKIPTVAANIVSTSCALVVSYLLNKKAVFRGGSKNRTRQFVLFVVVTLAGLWVLQPVIILSVSGLPFVTIVGDTWSLLIGKLVATVITLVWNYLWYSRVIFRKGQS